MSWLLNVNQIVRNVSRGYRTSGVCPAARTENGFFQYGGVYPPGTNNSPYITYLKTRKLFPSLMKEDGECRSWKELNLEERMFFSFGMAWQRLEKIYEVEQLSEKERHDLYEAADDRGERRRNENYDRPKRPLSAINLYVQDAYLIREKKEPRAPHIFTTIPMLIKTPQGEPYKTLFGLITGMYRYLVSTSKEVYVGLALELRETWEREMEKWNQDKKMRKEEEKKRERERKKQKRSMCKTSRRKSNASSTESSISSSVGSRELLDGEHDAKQKRIYKGNKIESKEVFSRKSWMHRLFVDNFIAKWIEEKKRQKKYEELIEWILLNTGVHKSEASSTEFFSSHAFGSNRLVNGEHETNQEQIYKGNELESKEAHLTSAKMACQYSAEAAVDRDKEENCMREEETERPKELQKQESSMLEIRGHKSNESSTDFSNSPAVGSNEVVGGEHEANEEQIYTESEVDTAKQKEKEKEAITEGR